MTNNLEITTGMLENLTITSKNICIKTTPLIKLLCQFNGGCVPELLNCEIRDNCTENLKFIQSLANEEISGIGQKEFNKNSIFPGKRILVTNHLKNRFIEVYPKNFTSMGSDRTLALRGFLSITIRINMISDVNIESASLMMERLHLKHEQNSLPPEEIIGPQKQNIFIFNSPRCGFDNRFKTTFTLLGRSFNSIEQYFVWQKARFFGDLELAEEVLMLNNPVAIKRIGTRIMYTGLWAKFTQNLQLFNQLRATGDGLITHASAYNLHWSNGLSHKSPCLNDPSIWEGENKLGELMMELRTEINTSIF
uniref:NADAR domain-containing protein n=2 Tax=Meloidogyne enterolobii TaxID=390850 RepID=A0A6V7XQB1_MELEN|nr:unnamed protein product [Meloidogyne enterolobii]